jgi:hypothetical protein
MTAEEFELRMARIEETAERIERKLDDYLRVKWLHADVERTMVERIREQ